MRTRGQIDAKSITLEEVMRLVKPNIKKIRGTGEIQMMCPLNPKEDFDVNVHTGGFKCWHNCPDCPVGGKGNSVNLYRLFNPGLSFGKAIKAIAENRVAPEKPAQQIQFKIPKPIKNSDLAPIEVRDKTYRAFLSVLTLSKEHQAAFRKRGLTDKQIAEMGIRSIPVCGMTSIPKILLAHGCVLKGVPLFGMKYGKWQLGLAKGKRGCYIPYFDREGRIQQLQIRYDVIETGLSEKELKAEKNNRYRWATSGFLANGCAASNVVYWGRAKQFEKEKTVFITEGGVKAAVASYLSGQWFVGTASCSTREPFIEVIDWCKANNKIPVDAYDMDGKILPDEKEVPLAAFNQNKASYPEHIVKEMEAGSNRILVRNKNGQYRVVNGHVLAFLKQFHEIAEERGLHLYTWYWDPKAKGIDDYLLEQTYRGGDLTWSNSSAIQDDDDNMVCDIEEMPENNGFDTLIGGRVNQAYIPDVFLE